MELNEGDGEHVSHAVLLQTLLLADFPYD